MTEEEKLKELFSDEAFAKKILELENSGEVVKALSEKGVNIPESSVVEIRNQLLKGESEELDEEALEQVSGGSITLAAVVAVASIVGSTAAIAKGVNTLTNRRW